MQATSNNKRGLQSATMTAPEPDAKSKSPRLTALALAGAVVLDTVAQLLWKGGVTDGKGNNWCEILLNTATQPMFILAMLMFLPKYFNWMYILSRADLTYAKPITSLSFITVLLFSAWFLHEQITAAKVIGVLLILVGVWQVGQTKPSTIVAPAKEQLQ